jgi:hypothetical protein
MPRPSAVEVERRLADGFALDELFGLTMGRRSEESKELALVELAALLAEHRVPYAIIGGVAMQVWSEEPRTTRDIDVALASYDDLPKAALEAAGFEHEGTFEHSDNWRAPGRTPRGQRTAVQFTVDELTPAAIARAETFVTREVPIRVASVADMLRLKLESAREPGRRPSKRTTDLADIQQLLEEHPDLAAEVPRLEELLADVYAQVELDRSRRR